MERFWSKVEYLHKTVKNKNIIIKGTKSYYSNAWSENFEDYVVRYLYGDEHSIKNWKPQWHIDRLYIGNYVCIGAETIILMGGNNTHRNDWFSNYPFMENILDSYRHKGDTVIQDGVWIGMRSMILPGITLGEGCVIAAGSIVTKNIPPYCIVGGNPSKIIKKRFDDDLIEQLLKLKIYDLTEEQIDKILPALCSNDISLLKQKISSLSG